eukprot:m.241726 g.241726  ORF g.241726 m.241726 type:complete len:2347 (-) comp33782_c0_seq1:119-7159(-)
MSAKAPNGEIISADNIKAKAQAHGSGIKPNSTQVSPITMEISPKKDAATTTLPDLDATPKASADNTDNPNRMRSPVEAAVLQPLQLESGRTEVVIQMLSILASGGEFNALGALRNPIALSAVVQALIDCTPNEQIELLSLLIVSATHSLLNREKISRHLSFERLLHLEASSQHEVVSRKVFQLIQLLGGHNISVKDLRSLLIAMRSDHPLFNPTRTFQILTALQAMSDQIGPCDYFHFVGLSSGISIPPIRKWPGQNGFSVNVWMRIGQDEASKSMYVYSFQTAQGFGYTARMISSKLVLSALDNGRVVAEHGCSYHFHSERWYMLTMTYHYSRLRRSTVKCFVDGANVDGGNFKFVSTQAPFSRCFIGMRDPRQEDTLFNGDMGAIYLFDKPLLNPTIEAMHKLGSGYFGNFLDVFDRDLNLLPEDIKEFSSAKLHNSVVFNYNPMACEKDHCLESSPAQGVSHFLGNPHARMLTGVTAIKSQYIQDALRANGGIQVLLPLFSQLKDVEDTAEQLLELPLMGSLLALICSLVCNFTTVQQEIEQMKGFLLLGFLLEQAEPRQLNLAVVDVFIETMTVLANSGSTITQSLLKSLFEDVVFNRNIWEKATSPVQRSLYSKVATFFSNIKINTREIPGVNRMLMLIRHFPELVDVAQDAREFGDEVPQDIVVVSGMALETIRKSFESSSEPPTPSEIEEILYHTKNCSMADHITVSQFIQFLSNSIQDHPSEYLRVDGAKTIASLFNLVQAPSERVQSQALQLIGTLLNLTTQRGFLELKAVRRLFDQLHQQLIGHCNERLVPSLVALTTRTTHPQLKSERSMQVVPEAASMLVMLCADEIGRASSSDPLTVTMLAMTSGVLDAVSLMLHDRTHCHRMVGVFDQLLKGVLSIFRVATSQLTSTDTGVVEAATAVVGSSESCIDLICIFALSELKDGWVWLRDFDAIVRLFFHTRFIDPKMVPLANTRSYDYIFCQFVMRLLNHFQKTFRDFELSNKSPITLVTENTVLVNNLVKYLCYVMQHVVTMGDYLTRMLCFVHKECVPIEVVERLERSESGNTAVRIEKSKQGSDHEEIEKLRSEMLLAEEQSDFQHLLVGINQLLLSYFGVLFTDARFIDGFETETKQMMNEEGTWELCACLVCNSILNPNAYWSDALRNKSTPNVRDAVLTETGIKTIEACINRCEAPTAVVSLVFTMIATASIVVYKRALEEAQTATFEKDVVISIAALQELVKGPFGDQYLQKALLASGGVPLLRPELAFWQPGGSVTTLVMHLASEQWSQTLRLHGKAALGKLMQRAIERQANREQLHNGLCSLIRQREDNDRVSRSAWEDTPLASLDLTNETEAEARERQRISAMSMWRRVLSSIANERGVWAPSASLPGGVDGQQTVAAVKVHWRLDEVEDCARRRKRMVRNEHGNSRLDATLDTKNNTTTNTNTASVDADGSMGEKSTWLKRVQRSLGFKLPTPPMMDASGLDDLDMSFADVTDDFSRDVSQSALEASMAAEKTTQKFVFGEKCVLIKPNHHLPGHLSIIGNEFFFRVDEASQVYVDAPLPIRAYFDGLNGKWSSSEVAGIMPRRLLLQHTAIEIFLKDRTPLFLSFATPAMCKTAMRHLPVEHESRFFFGSRYLFSNKRSRKETEMKVVTAKWSEGHLSNFDYLMFLNTMAGRTYCDLGQYPIFPWILSNYESEELDISDPRNYRDLSKPVGALNPKKLADAVKRFQNWDDEDMGAGRCHYGSHYSTPGSVLFWMIRVEPFSGFFLDLQGGRFDHPDRIFFSMKQAWSNVVNANSDVKELIPEMFYLPELFRNENEFDFGSLQGKSEKISDVELPTWATSAEDFVLKHREALESPYVSANLHKWIDLIFGVKQRGKAAEEAFNVFYYLSYEGGCDLDAIDDPTLLAAAKAQISDFGQVPQQLFKEPHPQRHVNPRQQKQMPEEVIGPVIGIDSHGNPVIGTDVSPESPVAFISTYGEDVVTISCNQCIWTHKFLDKFMLNPNVSNPVESGRRMLGETFDQRTTISPALFAMAGDHKVALACGYWDGSLKCFSIEGRFIQSVYAHSSVLTCVSSSPTGRVFATGSRDATVTVWVYTRSPFRVEKTPHAVLVGHEHPVVSLAVDAGLDAVLSASLDLCLMHKLNGDLVRVIHHPTAKRPFLLRLSSDGHIIIFFRDKAGPVLAVFTLNGEILASVSIGEQLMDMCISSDGRALATGGFGKEAIIWNVHDLSRLTSFETGGASIRSIAFSGDEKNVIMGLASGKVSCRRISWDSFSLQRRAVTPSSPVNKLGIPAFLTPPSRRKGFPGNKPPTTGHSSMRNANPLVRSSTTPLRQNASVTTTITTTTTTTGANEPRY